MTLMNTQIEQAYDSGLLNRDEHAMIVRDIEGIARTVGVPPAMIWTPLSAYCTEYEVNYMRKFWLPKPDGKDAGMVWSVVPHKKASNFPVGVRMEAMAGACIRNFINARYAPIHKVLAWLKDDNMPTPTALFIPDFYVGKTEGSTIATWQVSALLSMLLARHSMNLRTFLYVKDLGELGSVYGSAFKDLIDSQYLKTSV